MYEYIRNKIYKSRKKQKSNKIKEEKHISINK